jgi:hypothetical protein
MINRFDILMTFVAEVNAVSFLSFSEKIVKGFPIFVVAERAKHSIRLPLIPTIRAYEITFSNLFLQ